MLKIIVDSYLDLHGNLIVEAKFPYSILPSSKYRYDLTKRKIVIEVLKEYLRKSKKALETIIKTAEEDFKSRYGKKIKILSVKLKDIQFKPDFLYVYFNAEFQEEKKKKKKKDIILE